ncbi:MAG TPA: small-conductance mechanosensitive channel [Cyanobacteria bacterium UBA11149]|nr:small-conductance mechanosensitive channel [Cyanobacteria bacterium UBA11367]HBE57343.1 small-conductance mechanosensitive channel [Cyanobacteria bacterium UBA11366]HBR76713.1 small-conductance mechanosensitive channel [Cyanobacteria bacterium UBA11159]HBS70787.1 small-conductance mechanosensitive channel [Cyanobacteria bacterium UBA11153]HBW89827.1 small-conductance mechanosensitive channel [Cyanobacteria bacterium UBA11149]HCA94617.1 small-conductance mechanosensitive channel [Cyanobacter
MSTSNLWIIAVTGLLLFLYTFFINNPNFVAPDIVKVLGVIILIFGSIVIVNVLVLLIVDVWFARSSKKKPSALLRLVIALALYLVCGVIIALILGHDIASIFATSALISAVVGFALQSTLGNFFSGVALRIDQPFQLGDWVTIQEQEGVVVAITWRATTIVTNDGSLVHIPNGLMSEELLTTIPLTGKVQRSVKFLAPYTIPPQQVIDTVTHAILHQPVPNINLDQPVVVKMKEWEMGDEGFVSSYQVCYCPIHYSNAEEDTDREILHRVWYALNRQGFNPGYTLPSPTESYLNLIRAVDLFQDFSIEALSILVDRIDSLLFDRGEILNRHNLPDSALFIVARGSITVQQQVIGNGENLTVVVFSRKMKSQPPPPLNPKTLERLGYQLAQYIGPSAFQLTQSAAETETNLYWLYQQLAAEIQDSDDRQEFIDSGPSAPTEVLQSGDFWGEMSLLLGLPLPDVQMIAEVETEILVITYSAIAELLQQQSTLLELLIQRIARYQDDYLTGTLQMSPNDSLDLDTIANQMRQYWSENNH